MRRRTRHGTVDGDFVIIPIGTSPIEEEDMEALLADLEFQANGAAVSLFSPDSPPIRVHINEIGRDGDEEEESEKPVPIGTGRQEGG